MKLLGCTAHADPAKLGYLEQQLHSLKNLGIPVHFFIVTNITDAGGLKKIREHIPTQSTDFVVEIYNEGTSALKSPWLLTWVHKKIMRDRFDDESYSHFLYLEDDMDFTKQNFDYWNRHRETLRPHGLYPSFIRVEYDSTRAEWFWTDAFENIDFDLAALPSLKLTEDYWFVNLGGSYQGMFLYDRDLMREHIESRTFHLEQMIPQWEIAITHTGWPLGVTEAANYALTFHNVPNGLLSRNFLPCYAKLGLIDPCAYVHHMPNKFVHEQNGQHARLKMSAMFNKASASKSVSTVHASNAGKVSNKWSSYLPHYDALFGAISGKTINFLEIGVQNGGSLETWARYFSNAKKIIGCDIDRRCGELSFSDPRISVVVGNANSNEIYQVLAQRGPFDIVIDDGSHLSEDIIASFVNYFRLVAPGGIYVVEDTHAVYLRPETNINSQTNAPGFFRALAEVVNYQFWRKDASPADIVGKYFASEVPTILFDGWIESIEFRNSIITVKKSMKASHEKLGHIYITGKIAEVDEAPLLLANAIRDQMRTAAASV